MFSQIFCTAALLSTVAAHGVIIAAQGIAGSPQGVGFQGKVILPQVVGIYLTHFAVNNALPRNCSVRNFKFLD